MNNICFTTHKTGRLTCVWLPTGDVRSPLVCIWMETDLLSGSSPKHKSSDAEVDGMQLCA